MKHILAKLSLRCAVGLAVALWMQAPMQNSAWAQGKKEKKEKPKKVKEYNFDSDEIDGELQKPDGDRIRGMDAIERGSLLRIRQDFIKEIIKSAEDL